MSDIPLDQIDAGDVAPGDEGDGEHTESYLIYVVGMALAVILTVTSFVVADTSLVWGPSIPVAICTLAVAQMGVHIVFFLHITSGAEGINNSMALAFGVLIVMLLVGGSLFIMTHMNHAMMPMDQIMQMQR